MATSIPTYTLGAIDGFDLVISHKHTSQIEPYSAGISVYNGDRFYYNLDVVGNKSPLYGPGSVTYEVVKAEIVTVGDVVTREDCSLDPKTYIDNYGYIHVGKSNISTPEMIAANKYYEISFIPTYHYFNPTEGDIVTEAWETATIRPVPDNFDMLDEMYRSIPYSMSPNNALG